MRKQPRLMATLLTALALFPALALAPVLQNEHFSGIGQESVPIDVATAVTTSCACACAGPIFELHDFETTGSCQQYLFQPCQTQMGAGIYISCRG